MCNMSDKTILRKLNSLMIHTTYCHKSRCHICKPIAEIQSLISKTSRELYREQSNTSLKDLVN